MSPQVTIADICLNNIVTGLILIMPLLNDLNDGFGPPFIQSISKTIQALINLAQTVKRNQQKCAQVMQNIHQVLWTIINLYMKSETVEPLPLSMLDHIGKFRETLHKIYTYIEAQQEGNMIKKLFRSNEMNNLLRDCHRGLNQAVEVFGIQTGSATLNNIRDLEKRANLLHKELNELVETLSDTSTSTQSEKSLVYSGLNPSTNSSTSFSMLPSKPKIFHGRGEELDNIIALLCQESPRIAILGGGGMGKTSLAKEVLHHTDTVAQFEHRFFVSAEPSTTSIELAALMGLHVGLNPGQDLTKPVVQYFSNKVPCLLILDNLETVWEPLQSRPGVEEFLCLLTDLEHLALVITMRGAERPAKVRWTRPFLLPLEPLSNHAARQTFMDITDSTDTVEEMDQLLQFTDNMPLAVDLIAHLADYEGLSNVLSRWESEKTSLLSVGTDRTSNLNASINLSLSSSRITSDSKKLLSLLSILPNGLSDAELVQGNLGIPNILECKATLLATALAYQDSNRRILSLTPVREYIQQFLPPSESLIQSLRKAFYVLMELYQNNISCGYHGGRLQSVVTQITLNLANLHEVLKRGLNECDSDLADTTYCTTSLSMFFRLTGRDHTPLMDFIVSLLPQLCDHRLEMVLLTEVLRSPKHRNIVSEEAIGQVLNYLDHTNDPLLESKFYQAAAQYYQSHKADTHSATLFIQKAQKLAELAEDGNQQCNVSMEVAWLKYGASDYCAAQREASVAQRLSKLSGNLYQEARANWLAATCFRTLGQYQESAMQLCRARELIDICGLGGGALDHSITLEQAEIHFMKSEYAEARQISQQLVAITSAEAYSVCYANALINIALIDTICGVTEDVCQNLDTARKTFSSNHIFYEGVTSLCNMVQATIELRHGRFDIARTGFQKCIASLQDASSQEESFCLEQLANIKAWPASDSQYKWPVLYMGHAYRSKQKLALHKALLFLGDTFIFDNIEDTATNLYQVALEGFTRMDVHHSRAHCMLRLGDLANKQRHTSDAISLWRAAQPLFEQSSQAKDVARIESRLMLVEKAHQKALVKPETLHTPVQLVVKENAPEIEDKVVVDEPVEENVVHVAV
ncbi:hypothetical protein K438DRAFT_1763130 [Mycena galopus ATCC 62051]|nr:hypothetical protein K438DRAFT_1763130 [Mycena galopus ATCC 62051]